MDSEAIRGGVRGASRGPRPCKNSFFFLFRGKTEV